MLQAARATQRLWYPEFLPDPARPSGLPGADTPDRAADRPSGLSESFGTLRYGRLAEVLLYDVRRTRPLLGRLRSSWLPRWKLAKSARCRSRRDPCRQCPSNPPGWSAGKWGEWYPDLLGPDGKLSVARPKPYWQQGGSHNMTG